jgi:hypothetical protein
MTQIVVDIDPDIAERLELRAKRLGSTVQREVSRLIKERLDAEPGRSSDATAEEAQLPTAHADAGIDRLTRAGLRCGRASGPRLHILGGTSASSEAGIGAYQHPFAILEEQAGGFLAMVAGAGPFHDEETRVDTLDEAVDAILRIYRARGALPTAEAPG